MSFKTSMIRAIAIGIYVLLAVLAFLVLISIIIIVIQPTFFPEMDISGFEQIMDVVNPTLGILSVVLAIYSLYSSEQSNESIKKALNSTADNIICKVQGLESKFAHNTKGDTSTIKRSADSDKAQ